MTAIGQGQDGDESRLTCYELAPPGALAREADAVARLVRSALGVADPARHAVDVSAWSGWIRYVDQQLLWGGKPADLPPREQAQRRAEDWLRAFAKQLAPGGRQLPDAIAALAICPANFRPMELVAVARTDGGFDHWLYRAEPQVRSGRGQGLAPVIGAALEVRVGDGGRIVSFTARWRATTGGQVTSPRTPPRPPTLQSGHHDARPGHHGHQPEVVQELAYMLDGEVAPQPYLSPYYLNNTGHALSVASACPMSLTIDLIGRNVGDGTELLALIAGGSGDYRCEWGLTPLADPFELERLGEGRPGESIGDLGTSKVVVPVGAYLVFLEAHDRATGAVKHAQRHVYASGVLGTGEPARPPARDLVA
jgi:hypothetical protein